MNAFRAHTAAALVLLLAGCGAKPAQEQVQQANDAPAGQVAQDADPSHLQDVADLVGLQPGQGAEGRYPVGAGDVNSVDGDGV